ncbi:MAG TPA: IS200/IS605 family transposase [Candidatus Angelobacter sp.]
MSHTFARIHIHLIFSTKQREKLIPQEIQSRLWAYMASICHNKGIEPIAINGTDNHVHVLFHLPAIMALAKAVNLIKANSSRFMNEHKRGFAWQDGYGAFSVSESNTDAVIRYIRDQEKHHRKRTFEQEYVVFLKKHRFNFDPKYAFG